MNQQCYGEPQLQAGSSMRSSAQHKKLLNRLAHKSGVLGELSLPGPGASSNSFPARQAGRSQSDLNWSEAVGYQNFGNGQVRGDVSPQSKNWNLSPISSQIYNDQKAAELRLMALFQSGELVVSKSDQGVEPGHRFMQNRAVDNTSDWLRQALNSEANLTEGNQVDLRNQSSIDRMLITNQLVGMSAMQQHRTDELMIAVPKYHVRGLTSQVHHQQNSALLPAQRTPLATDTDHVIPFALPGSQSNIRELHANNTEGDDEEEELVKPSAPRKKRFLIFSQIDQVLEQAPEELFHKK